MSCDRRQGGCQRNGRESDQMPCSKMEFCFLSSQASASPVPMTCPCRGSFGPHCGGQSAADQPLEGPTSALLQNSEFSEHPNFSWLTPPVNTRTSSEVNPEKNLVVRWHTGPSGDLRTAVRWPAYFFPVFSSVEYFEFPRVSSHFASRLLQVIPPPPAMMTTFTLERRAYVLQWTLGEGPIDYNGI